jgi:hypothetical protein
LSANRLRYIKEGRLNASMTTLIAAVGGGLTTDAKGSPWHGLEPPSADFAPAVYTFAEGLFV